MKYIAIFDLPDGYKMGCASGKMIKPDGRKIYEDKRLKNSPAEMIQYGWDTSDGFVPIDGDEISFV